MNTDVLIDMLARGAGPAPQRVVARRLWPALLGGLFISGMLAWGVIGWLPWVMFETTVPWVKLGYAAALIAASSVLVARLARPVARLAVARRALMGVVVGFVALGALALWLTPADQRWTAVLGETWLVCPWTLMALSLPGLGVVLWAVRGLAPTRLKDAGFASGVLAGAIGAAGYSLACPEPSVTFVAIWYTLGIGLTALVGRYLGPRVLRW